MGLEWYNVFLQKDEDKIIQQWLNEIQNEYPGLYDLNDIRKNGKVYFHLLKDIHIPIEQQPLYKLIPHMCKYHAERETPVEHLLHSSHMWRDSILECMWIYIDENNVPIKAVSQITPQLHKQIDNLQREIIRIYWGYAKSLLQQKEQTINELHNDRLSMLGKMSASMAHEIRNPLTAIEGFLKLIRSELTSNSVNQDKIGKYLDIIENEYSGVYRQITGFLSFSKDNAYKESYIVCSCEEIINSMIDLVNPRLIDENINLKLSLNNESTFDVQKNAIQQVLFNLINNSIDALSFVEYPKVIKVRSYEDDTNHYIEVFDNGLGIPQEVQGNIFSPFVTSKKNGTGLGLAICKQLMENNGGSITFTSKKGETKFRLTLVKNCGLVRHENSFESGSYIL